MKHQIAHMNRTNLHRTTIALPGDLLAAVDQLVHTGSAPNRNQFITLAVETELRRREHARIDAEFALMAADPDYQAEAARIMRDFDASDRETWENLAKAGL
jgi:metal-responsive CopG/Arc/MetJ family transcriptional regulator